MRSAARPKAEPTEKDDLAPEYQFDYSKAKPNRFAGRMPEGTVAVVLDPDVARVFQDGRSVNAVLRALLMTMPGGRGQKP